MSGRYGEAESGMELRLSGRTITPGLEALAGATINATARTIIVDLVSLSGSTSAADGVPLDAAGGTVALRSAAGCRSSSGHSRAWKTAAVCGGSAISLAPPPQAISAGGRMSVGFTGHFSVVE